MNGATLTLEASTTNHTTDAVTGVEIKTGDPTRTLVGMARPIAGPAWQDTTSQRFVVSWFNRRALHCQAVLGANTGTSSTSSVELSTTLRNEFLWWGDSMVDFSFDGYASNSTTPATVASFLALDGVIQEAYNVFLNTAVNQLAPVSIRCVAAPNTEGYHFISPYVSVNTGTGTWVGSGTPGLRSVCKGVVWG
jgi:hypothetical protein